MFYVYILYSESSNIYYIGHSEDVLKRIKSHNNPVRIKFTSKHLPWVLKCAIPIGASRSEAMKWEKYLKSLKSRKIIELIIEERQKEIRKVRFKSLSCYSPEDRD